MKNKRWTVMALVASMVLCGGVMADDIELLNEVLTENGVLFGGQPSEEQLEAIAAAGYRTVIDLRGTSEARGYDEAAAMEAAGLEYVTVPVSQDTLSGGNPFADFVEVFKNAERPVVVHCASGNRVGAAYYAFLVAEEGLSREEALQRARDNGLHSAQLEAAVDRYLDSL
jgi:uncharacterized protein (TIGR01244 family)